MFMLWPLVMGQWVTQIPQMRDGGLHATGSQLGPLPHSACSQRACPIKVPSPPEHKGLWPQFGPLNGQSTKPTCESTPQS